MVVSRSVFSSPADLGDCPLLCSPDSLDNAPGAWKNVVTDGTDAMPNATQSWLKWSWPWLGLSHESESEGISLWSDTKIIYHVCYNGLFATQQSSALLSSNFCIFIWYGHNKKPGKCHEIAFWGERRLNHKTIDHLCNEESKFIPVVAWDVLVLILQGEGCFSPLKATINICFKFGCTKSRDVGNVTGSVVNTAVWFPKEQKLQAI